MKPLTVIFLGRSGSGKGTQVEKLTEVLTKSTSRPVFHMESGKRFREFIAGPTHAASLSRAINETGGLQPEFLSVWVWTGELVGHLTAENHLLIDGSPRRLSEARILESALQFFKRDDVAIIHIKVTRAWAVEKLTSRGRADDVQISDVNSRMDWFEKEVEPVVKYFSSHPTISFAEVDGEQTIEQVHADIVRALGL